VTVSYPYGVGTYEIVSDPLLVLYEVLDGTDGTDTDGVDTYEVYPPLEVVPDTLVMVPPFLVVDTDSVNSEVPPYGVVTYS